MPFPPTAHTASNVGINVKCMACGKPRLLHSRKKLKSPTEENALKRVLNGIGFVCGTSLQEVAKSSKNRDSSILDLNFCRVNLACSSKVELPYYSTSIFKEVCVQCGKGKRVQPNSDPQFYPQCLDCTEPRVLQRKRKQVLECDLKKKQKQTKLM